MTKIILSPHIDDVVLSIGGSLIQWLERGITVSVVNVFSRSASPFFWRSGAECNSKKETELRKAEEARIAKKLGDIFVYLDYPSCTCRELKYFRPWLPVWLHAILPTDRKLFRVLKRYLGEVLKEHVELYIPIAPDPGAHIDHVLLRDSCLAAIEAGQNHSCSIFLYEDQPYCSRHKIDEILIEAGIEFDMVGIDIDRKIEISRMYESQVRSKWLMEIEDYHNEIGGERFWRFTSRNQFPFKRRFK